MYSGQEDEMIHYWAMVAYGMIPDENDDEEVRKPVTYA